MTSFEHSVEIERPLEEVWSYVCDFANNPVWQGPIVEVRSGATQQVEVGTTLVEVAQFLGKRFEITLEVAEHDLLKRSVVRTVSGPVRLEGSYRFERADGRTRFTTAGDVEGHGFFRLAEPVFARMARREWASSCETLKELLEAGAGTP